jgi:hypothetical protein
MPLTSDIGFTTYMQRRPSRPWHWASHVQANVPSSPGMRGVIPCKWTAAYTYTYKRCARAAQTHAAFCRLLRSLMLLASVGVLSLSRSSTSLLALVSLARQQPLTPTVVQVGHLQLHLMATAHGSCSTSVKLFELFLSHMLPHVPTHSKHAGLKSSTGLSQAAIVGGSLTGVLVNLARRHPWEASRPLVDMDVALVLTPALLCGVSSGGNQGIPGVHRICSLLLQQGKHLSTSREGK